MIICSGKLKHFKSINQSNIQQATSTKNIPAGRDLFPQEGISKKIQSQLYSAVVDMEDLEWTGKIHRKWWVSNSNIQRIRAPFHAV